MYILYINKKKVQICYLYKVTKEKKYKLKHLTYANIKLQLRIYVKLKVKIIQVIP